MHGNRRGEMVYVLTALSVMVLGILGLVVAVALMRPRAFPHPFVMSATTTTTRPTTTTVPVAQRLGTSRLG